MEPHCSVMGRGTLQVYVYVARTIALAGEYDDLEWLCCRFSARLHTQRHDELHKNAALKPHVDRPFNCCSSEFCSGVCIFRTNAAHRPVAMSSEVGRAVRAGVRMLNAHAAAAV